VEPNEPKHRLTPDQKRARLVLVVIIAVIAVVAIGIGWLAFSIGLPPVIAVIITVVVAAIVGLFMFLNLA
jgi:biotin transporter BioY